MQCIKCKKEIKDTDRFCEFCGTEQIKENKEVIKPVKQNPTLNIRILAIVGICVAVVGICAVFFFNSGKKDVEFLNDTESRKELYEQSPEVFSDPNEQLLADQLYLTRTPRGTQEPNPVVTMDGLDYIRPLGDGFYYVFDCEDKGEYISGRTKIIDENDNVIMLSETEERGYYDEKGNIYKAEFIHDDGSSYAFEFIEEYDIEEPSDGYYYIEFTQIYDNREEYGSYWTWTDKLTGLKNSKSESIIYDNGKIYGERGYHYIYDENNRLSEQNYSFYYYSSGDSTEYTTDYSFLSDLVKQTTGSGYEYTTYNGYRILAIDDFYEEKIKSFYDNNGLRSYTEHYDYDDNLLYKTFYAYDFADRCYYTYTTDTTDEIVINEIETLEVSQLFQWEIFQRIDWNIGYTDNINSKEAYFSAYSNPFWMYEFNY